MLSLTDGQYLEEVRLRNRSLDSIRQSILQLSRQNLELLTILADLQQEQQGKAERTFDRWLEALPLYLALYTRGNNT